MMTYVHVPQTVLCGFPNSNNIPILYGETARPSLLLKSETLLPGEEHSGRCHVGSPKKGMSPNVLAFPISTGLTPWTGTEMMRICTKPMPCLEYESISSQILWHYFDWGYDEILSESVIQFRIIHFPCQRITSPEWKKTCISRHEKVNFWTVRNFLLVAQKIPWTSQNTVWKIQRSQCSL